MTIDAFIQKWAGTEGGAERANAALYTLEMLQALGLPAPDPAGATSLYNDYVFERAVRSTFESGAPKRIDLYKRGCFLMEHKQSRLPGMPKSLPFDESPLVAPTPPTREWDALFRNARAQAFAYVAMLPADHVAPPFVIICDVGRLFEIWADFSGTGRGYAPFPDRRRHRFTHADLANPRFRRGFARSGPIPTAWTRRGSPPSSHAKSPTNCRSSPVAWNARACRRRTRRIS